VGNPQATSYKLEVAGSRLRFVLVGLRLVACSLGLPAAKTRRAAFFSNAATALPLLQMNIQNSKFEDQNIPPRPAASRHIPPPTEKFLTFSPFGRPLPWRPPIPLVGRPNFAIVKCRNSVYFQGSPHEKGQDYERLATGKQLVRAARLLGGCSYFVSHN
jgi:hypothetical protein